MKTLNIHVVFPMAPVLSPPDNQKVFRGTKRLPQAPRCHSHDGESEVVTHQDI